MPLKMIKKYIIIPYFRAGLMVTQVVQPPQHVANCFQLLKLLGGTIKAPHVYGLREGENYWYYTLLVFPIQVWFPVPPALSQFIVGNPVSLRCTSLYMSSRMHQFGRSLSEARAGRIRTTVLLEGRGRIRWSLHLITFVHAIYNTEVPCCSRNKRVSVCFYVWEYLLYKHSLWFI